MKIGQILFLLSKQTKSVVPVKIVEKTIKETEQGTQTTFNVMHTSGRVFSLSQTDKYFQNAGDARGYLQVEAQKLINAAIDFAENESLKFQVANDETASVDKQPGAVHTMETDDTMHTEETFVTLPDGRMAKVKIRSPEA